MRLHYIRMAEFQYKIDTFACMNANFDNKKVEKISKALGDPYRIKIMQAIKEEKDWLQCQAITQMFNLAQSTISHHINQLVDADLLHAEKDGRFARYKINKEVIGDYVSYLSDFSEK
ncbi:MAG: ArsR family transcriptional regulator, arsenate/arsenite/antimonite-responsive transcriptional [Mucilaginibacter sp.]|nr:ArsR family transcriptional regulator, arsenate/arsenite/antimonite-responsive transcriptional [Mucilaginibacter sp.]